MILHYKKVAICGFVGAIGVGFFMTIWSMFDKQPAVGIVENKQTSKGIEMMSSKVANDVYLVLSVPDNTESKKQIPLELTIQNLSESEIYLGAGDILKYFDVRVVDSNGSAIERTSKGKMILKPEVLISSGAMQILKPFEARKFQVNLRELFDVQQGSYTVAANIGVSREAGGSRIGLVVESNRVTFMLE